MTKEQALKILIEHNEWRVGNGKAMQYPPDITAAINVAIELLKTTLKTKQ